MVITGHKCDRGKAYVTKEMTSPERTLTTTIKENGKLVSVRTDKPIPKEKIMPAMEILRSLDLDNMPKYGEVVVENILDTGANVVVTRE